MLNPFISHFVTVPLLPTASQAQALERLSGSGGIAESGLVQPAGPEILSIDAVGPVLVDATDMPGWAHEALWCQPAPGEPTDQVEIMYSGSAYLERGWIDGNWIWTVALDFAEIW